ncbi:hypothetical protein ABZV60_02815 [Streptomyces sp. NPDC004787]|uniref:hypothetical protein n=1 Tax=Streptomyces sp. NPDC004787 TaxID=3154291 RepID=UPI0033B2848A
MHEQAPHHTETAESGSFAFARCSCGWRGPARRSRDRARTDASEHTERAEPSDRAAERTA